MQLHSTSGDVHWNFPGDKKKLIGQPGVKAQTISTLAEDFGIAGERILAICRLANVKPVGTTDGESVYRPEQVSRACISAGVFPKIRGA